MENVVVEADGEKGMPVAGLVDEWDRCDAIRSHLRVEGNVIFKAGADPTVKEACRPWIHGYLAPMLIRMASNDGKPQPLVDPLRDEIANLYKTASKQVDDSQVIYDSWMTRKFLGLVKMKARKKLPSTDVWLLLSMAIYHDAFWWEIMQLSPKTVIPANTHLDKDQRFQELVLILDPMLQENAGFGYII